MYAVMFARVVKSKSPHLSQEAPSDLCILGLQVLPLHWCPDRNICPLQILLVSDYFYAFLRREHHLTNGLYLKRKDGSEATLILK